jgi:hypothetical protein
LIIQVIQGTRAETNIIIEKPEDLCYA